MVGYLDGREGSNEAGVNLQRCIMDSASTVFERDKAGHDGL